MLSAVQLFLNSSSPCECGIETLLPVTATISWGGGGSPYGSPYSNMWPTACWEPVVCLCDSLTWPNRVLLEVTRDSSSFSYFPPDCSPFLLLIVCSWTGQSWGLWMKLKLHELMCFNLPHPEHIKVKESCRNETVSGGKKNKNPKNSKATFFLEDRLPVIKAVVWNERK